MPGIMNVTRGMSDGPFELPTGAVEAVGEAVEVEDWVDGGAMPEGYEDWKIFPCRAKTTRSMDSNSLTEAAEKAGIPGRAMYEYLHSDGDFARTYQKTRTGQTIAFADSLTARREHALDVIMALMDDADLPGGVRLKAAQAILAVTAEQVPVGDTIVTREVSRARERERGFLDWDD